MDGKNAERHFVTTFYSKKCVLLIRAGSHYFGMLCTVCVCDVFLYVFLCICVRIFFLKTKIDWDTHTLSYPVAMATPQGWERERRSFGTDDLIPNGTQQAAQVCHPFCFCKMGLTYFLICVCVCVCLTGTFV